MSVQHAKTYKPVQEYVDRFKSGEFDLGAVYVGMVAEMAEVLTARGTRPTRQALLSGIREARQRFAAFASRCDLEIKPGGFEAAFRQIYPNEARDILEDS